MTAPVLTGREYKLLLDPRKFAKRYAPGEEADFWQDRLTGLIASSLDATPSGKPRHSGQLEEDKQRNIHFLDTGEGLLATHGFCLRLRRTAAAEDGKSQVTLKFRSPDYFIASGLDLPGSKPKVETKFEEDIAPLAVFAGQPSIRSRYALSAMQKAAEPETLADLWARFPKLKTALKQLGGGITSENQPLVSGPLISEITFSGAAVDFGGGIKANFALSLWNMGKSDGKPRAAEISFAVKLTEGTMPPILANRALRLFTSMQSEFAAIRETRELSKTALAIPVRTGDP